MKKSKQHFRLVSIVWGTAWLSLSCQKPGIDYGLAGGTRGIYEWVSTTTPRWVSTPQSVGYTKQLAVLSDQQGAYVGFYRNDTLQRRLNETSTASAHTWTDEVAKTVLIQYQGAGFIRYNLSTDTNGETITVSELLSPDSFSADSVHSVYKRVNKSLYPY